ncbi:MAG: hypothetical protein ACF8PN_06320 [Phycisphaerales bacterium]
MIITPEFVLVNFPKTGSTFARVMLSEIDRRRDQGRIAGLRRTLGLGRPFYRELMLPNLRREGRRRHRSQHGTVAQIPERYRDRPVVCVVRNPFDRYVSQFRFGHWKHRPSTPQRDEIRDHFPAFPDLSFEQFLEFCEFERRRYRMAEVSPRSVFGLQTAQFVRMVALRPAAMLNRLDAEHVASGDFVEDLPDLRLLRTDRLNEGLFQLLVGFGYDDEEVAFIRDQGRVLPPGGTERGVDDDWKSYYDPPLFERIRERERLLLRMYERLGVIESGEWDELVRPTVGSSFSGSSAIRR